LKVLSSRPLAGVFLTNSLLHLIHGINGDAFPTPFADPPGTRLSSPVINIFWAVFNIIIGVLLLKTGKVSFRNKYTVILFICGIGFLGLIFSVMSASMLVNYKH
jgi:hypothetical protein